MRSVPLELPVRADLAGRLADLIFEQLKGRPLTTEARARFAGRVAAASIAGITIFPGSLQKDPIHPSTYYIAIAPEKESSRTLLLRVASASSPSSAVFPNAILIGRMRTNSGDEVVINAVPFGPDDRDVVRTFVEQIDPAFLPRPQGGRSAIEVTCSRPPADLAAAFDAFRNVAKRSGANLAAIAEDDFEAVLRAAVLSGWRDGYTAEPVGRTTALGSYSKFTIHATGASPDALRGVEAAFDAILAALPARRHQFDFELALAGGHPTTPQDLSSCLEFLKSGDRSPRLVAPEIGFRPRQPFSGNIQELGSRVARLAEVARKFNATLSIHHGEDKQREVVGAIGRATAKRVNYRIEPGSEGGSTTGYILWIAECLFA